MDDAHESLRARYREFAVVECHEYSPHYARLARAVADDDGLLSFIGDQPDPQPNLFLASVQYLSGADAMPCDGHELAGFVEARAPEIAALMRTRRTQTNEIGRCAALLPALPTGVPLALIEVGASAGLCLRLDRYRYRYGPRAVGPTRSPVRLECTSLGSVPIPVPAEMPQVVWQRGLDLCPVDVRDADSVKWLVACVWADHVERRTRLKAAIALSRSDPPSVVTGDLVDALPNLIAQAPDAATLVVFHSALMPYVPEPRRERFLAVLARESERRAIVWISNEGPGAIPELDAQAPKRKRLKFRVGRSTWRGGSSDHELLALAHYHGWDLEWLASQDI